MHAVHTSVISSSIMHYFVVAELTNILLGRSALITVLRRIIIGQSCRECNTMNGQLLHFDLSVNNYLTHRIKFERVGELGALSRRRETE